MTETHSHRITRKDIEEVKRQHILQTLLYTPQEVALILAVSVRTIFILIEDGELISANGSKGAGRTRITAESVEMYRKRIVR